MFVPYAAWERNKEGLRKNLLHFVRAAHARGMGVMPTMQYKFGEWRDKAAWPNARPFVADLVATIGKEPGLAIWDVENEPECCKLPPTPDNRLRMEHAMYMAKVFHELDPGDTGNHWRDVCGKHDRDGRRGGCALVPQLQPHARTDSRQHRESETVRGKSGKPLVNSEIGCIARANPYDVALQEHMQAHVGWYIWELMITGNWGTVHGVFYPDGTVRDPSIAPRSWASSATVDRTLWKMSLTARTM